MKQFFELKIKPINDCLGANLGIKKISVITYSAAYDIPVKLSINNQYGHRIEMTNQHLANVRAMGLSI